MTDAVTERDGVGCLRALDQLDALGVASDDQTRGTCELLADRCADGEARLRALARARGDADPAAFAGYLTRANCPPRTGPSLSRLARLEIQAALPPHRPARCAAVARWTEEVEGALAATADEGLHGRLANVWQGVALCWAGAGRCADAEAAVRRSHDRLRLARPGVELPAARAALATLDARCVGR